jgi:hypothetical protein
MERLFQSYTVIPALCSCAGMTAVLFFGYAELLIGK